MLFLLRLLSNAIAGIDVTPQITIAVTFDFTDYE